MAKIPVACPTCDFIVEVPDAMRGMEIKCPQCHNVMTVQSAPAAAPAQKPAQECVEDANNIPPQPVKKKSGAVGKILGCLGVLFLLLIIALAAILIPAINSAREAAKFAQCQNQLKMIGNAIMMYSVENKDMCPDSIWLLRSSEYSLPTNDKFACAAKSDSYYVYLGKDLVIGRDNPNIPIVFEMPGSHSDNRINVLYLGGNTSTFKVPKQHNTIPAVANYLLKESCSNLDSNSKSKETIERNIKFYEYYLKASAGKDAQASYDLAMCYWYGKGTAVNFTEVVKWLRHAADMNHSAAQNDLGVCYFNGNGVEKDTRAAIQWYEKAAANGSPTAMRNLAYNYEHGNGVAKNMDEALKYYTMSANHNNSDSQYWLGEYYTGKDKAAAFSWYLKAAERGHVSAQYQAGLCYDEGYGVNQNYYQAFRWYEKAAYAGHTESMNNLGVAYKHGKGCTKNIYTAVRWFRKAAEAGSAYGQYNLADRYYYGEGVTKNYYEAFKWYEKAANQGHAGAQCDLGFCYILGNGVSENKYTGFSWIKRSADQGNARALNMLGFCHERGIGTSKNPYEAARLYRKSADLGNAQAQYNLGICYINGIGVEKNVYEARKWIQKAADQGHEDAKKMLN